MISKTKKAEEIVDELFSTVPINHRCKYLRKDDIGPYCSKNLVSGRISDERRMVCDVVSLQVFCLDMGGFVKCTYYQEKWPLGD